MEYYYPYLTSKKDCRGCHECVDGCPVQAIIYDDEWEIDREKCKNYQKKIKDLCMRCTEYCRKKLIQLKGES
ncbi:MAG TPA: 4Fe-4S double cluster binding domain-containing protein [Candidatus Deferrimicrobium sp.]|nr:4Fe-4S double cluster binding domain-containing protein [Candidatus Deferrimicrobium sp.]